VRIRAAAVGDEKSRTYVKVSYERMRKGQNRYYEKIYLLSSLNML
jgi:hypothetical protein